VLVLLEQFDQLSKSAEISHRCYVSHSNAFRGDPRPDIQDAERLGDVSMQSIGTGLWSVYGGEIANPKPTAPQVARLSSPFNTDSYGVVPGL
jgi:hypothetical protein